MIELNASDGRSFSAYRAEPADTPKGAVVVISEDLGVTAQSRQVADGFAAKGYVAIAPSLFDRVTPKNGAADDGAPATEQVEVEKSFADIQTAVDAVKGAGKVALVGFGRGGDLAYASANRIKGIACMVGFDGSGIVSDYREKRRVPTLLHFGEDDALIPIDDITQFRAHRPDVSTFTYPGAIHGFSRDERDGVQQQAAEKALERTLSFISQYVEGQPPVLLKNAGSYAQAKTEKKKKKKGSDDMGPPMD
jgi:carboxymethylenebutenolidase